MRQVAHQAGAYPGFCEATTNIFSPLDGILVYHRVTSSINFAGTHLYTWVESSTVRVKCFAQEHNTMSPDRSTGDERSNHEATAPPKRFFFRPGSTGEEYSSVKEFTELKWLLTLS